MNRSFADGSTPAVALTYDTDQVNCSYGAVIWVRWVWEPVDGRIVGRVGGTCTTRDATWYNAQNRLHNVVLGIRRDAAGNLDVIGGYARVYDGKSRLKISTMNSVTMSYAWDGAGKRVKKSRGTETTVYVYNAQEGFAAEYDAASAPSARCMDCCVRVDELASTTYSSARSPLPSLLVGKKEAITYH